MAGNATNEEVLNDTLELVCKGLNKRGIENWFIAYGTLLGIIRDSSCIPHDDDIDILICETHYDLVVEVLDEMGIEAWDRYSNDNSTKHILKTKPTSKLASVDFYFCPVTPDGTFFDVWDATWWYNCFNEAGALDVIKWRGATLNVPYDVETKLTAKYGEWRTPVRNLKNHHQKHIGRV
jgi:hypothetical protein